MTADTFLFWFLAVATVSAALAVVLLTNPIYCALSLGMTMVCVAAIFVTLQAYFLAGVQLIVYAGAVIVLFVMVLMLFDLKSELQAFSRGKIKGAIKIGAVGILAGLIVGVVTRAVLAGKKAGAALAASASSTTTNEALTAEASVNASSAVGATRPLAENLFYNHVFGFEALGVLLLVVAVGVVAVSRSKGGTHAKL